MDSRPASSTRNAPHDSAGRLGSITDLVTAGLVYAMIVFSPWAFGTTQLWSVQWMNAGGYALGALLLIKCIARRQLITSSAQSVRRVSFALLLIIGLILAYVFVAAVNAEFTYVAHEFRRDPRPYIKWLPHSLDRLASWQVFRNWVALACVFWAVHDWLKSAATPDGRHSTRRLRQLIAVLAINGALVALEGILQRSSGTPKLLWFQPTHDNPVASAQFGPYAYRANAAQLFNLIWPPSLALWWHLHFRPTNRRRSQRHHWLLPAVMLLVVASLFSLSRGGVAIALLQACACACFLLVAGRFSAAARLQIGLVFLVAIGVGAYLGGDEIAKRIHDNSADPIGVGRTDSYRLAARMADDYPWFGVGPGAYDSVFQEYRNSPDDFWPGQLHNDWLEYLITLGRIGFGLVLAAGVVVAARWWFPGGLRLHWTFAAFIWIALAGCLMHARFDFPLQIYSIQFVFVLLTAVLFTLSRTRVG